MPELVQVAIGGAGIGISMAYLADLAVEHRIDKIGNSNNPRGKTHVNFCETSTGKFIPRILFADFDTLSVENLLESHEYGGLIDSDSIFVKECTSGNTYAKAFSEAGPSVAHELINATRIQLERCDCVLAINICHSISQGAGSGLCGLYQRALIDTLDSIGKVHIQNTTLVPSHDSPSCVVEPYNAILSLADLLELSAQVFTFDNDAISRRCVNAELSANYSSMNNIIAYTLAGLSCSSRFPGCVSADFRKMGTYLIPFPRVKFFCSTVAPLVMPSMCHDLCFKEYIRYHEMNT